MRLILRALARGRGAGIVANLLTLADDAAVDEKQTTGRSHLNRKFGGAARNRTGDGGFADLCLTAWRRRPLKACGRTEVRPYVPCAAELKFGPTYAERPNPAYNNRPGAKPGRVRQWPFE